MAIEAGPIACFLVCTLSVQIYYCGTGSTVVTAPGHFIARQALPDEELREQCIESLLDLEKEGGY